MWMINENQFPVTVYRKSTVGRIDKDHKIRELTEEYLREALRKAQEGDVTEEKVEDKFELNIFS